MAATVTHADFLLGGRDAAWPHDAFGLFVAPLLAGPRPDDLPCHTAGPHIADYICSAVSQPSRAQVRPGGAWVCRFGGAAQPASVDVATLVAPLHDGASWIHGAACLTR